MNHKSSFVRTLLGLVLLAGILAVAACGTTSGATSTNTPTSSPPTATAAVTPTTSGLTGYPIKVYFSNNPGTMSVTPVTRISPTIDTGTYSIQMLIAGPTPQERAQGLFSELNSAFSGPTICAGPVASAGTVGGPDFTLTLNMKGTTPEQGTATLKFCRPTTLAGDFTGPRIMAEIDATLEQFSSIKKVVILDSSGNCWAALKTGNDCLK